MLLSVSGMEANGCIETIEQGMVAQAVIPDSQTTVPKTEAVVLSE